MDLLLRVVLIAVLCLIGFSFSGTSMDPLLRVVLIVAQKNPLLFASLLVIFFISVLWKVMVARRNNRDSHSGDYSKHPQYRNVSAKRVQKFSLPIPKLHKIYVTSMLVAGIQFRQDAPMRFANDSSQTLELVREQNNPHDKNAIKVIGVTPTSRYFVGYVPKEVSEQIIETDLLEKVKPRLIRIYQANNGFVEIHFQIVGLKEYKPQFDAFIEKQLE